MKSRIALLVLASFLVFAATASRPASIRAPSRSTASEAGSSAARSPTSTTSTNDFDHTHVDVADDAAYGGRIGYNFTSLFQLEAEYSRTETQLRPAPAATLPDVNLGRPDTSSTS